MTDKVTWGHQGAGKHWSLIIISSCHVGPSQVECTHEAPFTLITYTRTIEIM